jgi:hypothetical protein
VATPLKLGVAPGDLKVNINPGSTFRATLRSQDDNNGDAVPWPAGTTLRLVISKEGASWSASWPWTIDEEWARLVVPGSETAELPSGRLEAQLFLNYGGGEFLWCSGEVVKYD